jgi:aryl-alcohol dehydrogenase-like predicted oxidoreductase
MQYSQLGSSGIEVSRVCLGTMTWGFQNNQQDADQQLDYALGKGINFVDTAEMYAVPPSADTYGKTETIIGNYLAVQPGKRQDMVLASKIAGPGLSYIRGGAAVSGETVKLAIEASLQRLQTDYIDLYQIHWPNRTSPHFGKHAPGAISFTDVDRKAQSALMLDILIALDESIKAGKIRHWGLSNETPWGINEYLRLAEIHNLAKPVSIQNEFNILHAKDWPYLIESCVHNDVAYLPWSPLAGGALSGKYADGAIPKGSRWSFDQRNGLFRNTPELHAAVAAYTDIAKRNGMTSAQLALAWCDQVDGVTSTIIGATSMGQLEENIAAFDFSLSSETLKEIRAVLKQYPMPF